MGTSETTSQTKTKSEHQRTNQLHKEQAPTEALLPEVGQLDLLALPDVATTRRLRQDQILRMQSKHGNAFVQHLLIHQTTETKTSDTRETKTASTDAQVQSGNDYSGRPDGIAESSTGHNDIATNPPLIQKKSAKQDEEEEGENGELFKADPIATDESAFMAEAQNGAESTGEQAANDQGDNITEMPLVPENGDFGDAEMGENGASGELSDGDGQSADEAALLEGESSDQLPAAVANVPESGGSAEAVVAPGAEEAPQNAAENEQVIGEDPTSLLEESETPAEPEETSTERGQLLGDPEIPLAGAAGEHISQIHTSSDESVAQVRAEAMAKREQVYALFAERRQSVATFIDANLLSVIEYVNQKRAAANEWILDKVHATQTFVQSLITQAMEAGTSVTNLIQQGVSQLTSGIVNGVGGIVDRVLDVARSIPIPNIPGIGRIRTAVLNAANRVAGVIRSALQGIQTFINRAVSSVLQAINAVISKVGAAVSNMVAQLVSVFTQLLAQINQLLSNLTQQLRAIIQQIGNQVQAVLTRTEGAAIGQINEAEAAAIAEIEQNRQHGQEVIDQILEFAYSRGDYPADEATTPHLDTVDSSSATDEFEGAAIEAMMTTVQGVQERNAEVVTEFSSASFTVVGMITNFITGFISEVWTAISNGYQAVSSQIEQAIGQLMQAVETVITQVTEILRSLGGRIISALESVVNIIVDVVRAPVDALTNLAGSIISGVRRFFSGIVSRVVTIFSSDTGGDTSGLFDTSTLTAPFKNFTPSRLAAEARMSSPPAAAAAALVFVPVAIAEAAAAVAAAALTVLMWIAIIGLIILAIYLIYRLIVYMMSKPKAVPRAKPRTRTKPRTRRRRRRQRRKKLYWNPSLVYGVVTGSGGMPGTLDTTEKLPTKAPLHGHHVWPKYVGGPQAQALMSIRGVVHQGIIHPSLHAVMVPVAKMMGFDIVPNATNPAFIAHLRTNPQDRATFGLAITSYYGGLNAITDPPIPPPAYMVGIAESLAHLG